MENTSTNIKTANKKIRKPFNKVKFAELLEKNKKSMVDHVFSEAVHLALIAKYGSWGILPKHNPSHDKDNVSAMVKSMSPLLSV